MAMEYFISQMSVMAGMYVPIILVVVVSEVNAPRTSQEVEKKQGDLGIHNVLLLLSPIINYLLYLAMQQP